MYFQRLSDEGLEEDSYYSLEEVTTLLNIMWPAFMTGKFNRVRNYFMVGFALNTGLRVEELTDLLHGDFFVTLGKCYLVVRSGKGDKWRAVTISEELRDEYLTYSKWKQTEGLSSERDDYVFCKSNGKKLTVRAIQKAFTLSAREAGLEKTNIHCLRHTYLTQLDECGAPARFIQKQAGHTSLETTQRYIGLSKKRQIIMGSLSQLYRNYRRDTNVTTQKGRKNRKL